VESFCFYMGNMLNFSVYLPKFGWIGGKFPPNNSYASESHMGLEPEITVFHHFFSGYADPRTDSFKILKTEISPN
jgi:hypothetical protein